MPGFVCKGVTEGSTTQQDGVEDQKKVFVTAIINHVWVLVVLNNLSHKP